MARQGLWERRPRQTHTLVAARHLDGVLAVASNPRAGLQDAAPRVGMLGCRSSLLQDSLGQGQQCEGPERKWPKELRPGTGLKKASRGKSGAMCIKTGIRSPKLASDLRSASRGSGCNGAIVQNSNQPSSIHRGCMWLFQRAVNPASSVSKAHLALWSDLRHSLIVKTIFVAHRPSSLNVGVGERRSGSMKHIRDCQVVERID